MTANSEIEDALIRHEIYLLRYSNTSAETAYNLLDKLKSNVRNLMFKQGTRLTKPQLKRVKIRLRKIYRDEWSKVSTYIKKELQGLAVQEADFVKETIESVMPVQLNLTLPSQYILGKTATRIKFSGKNIDGWVGSVRDDITKRVTEVLDIGTLQGHSIDKMTKNMGVFNGVEQRNLKNIVRTANKQVSSDIKKALYKANADILSKVRFVATLDSRTTLICASYDGEVFSLGKAPSLPLHWGCRSNLVPAILPETIGERPEKPTTEKRLVRNFCKKKGLKPPLVLNRKNLPYGYKTAYDKYRREELAKIIGRVPAKTTYSDWLKTQSAEFQDDVLGKKRGRLFREGKMPLTKFIDRKTKQPYTLKTLKQRDAESFARAGLLKEKDT